MANPLGGLDQEMKRLVRAALGAGCTLERRTRHWALRLPDGSLITVASSSTGRASRNLRADLRRRGVQV
jgi:hypothetical protein